MSKKFQGVFTAIVTPFGSDGSVDWDALEQLVEFQIAGGVAGIVPCGTTGESPTLSHGEHSDVIERVVKWVNGRCLVIGGTGSNSTDEAVELSVRAAKAGVDACLQVNPYYNKPTQEGLYRHFKAIADAVDVDIMLYNIQGRTGVNLETPTLLRLLDSCGNISSVKEASGNIEQIKEVIAQTPDEFAVLSGDDNITLDLIRAGGDGVVSVSSNVIPGKIVEFVSLALGGDFDAAASIHEELMPFFEGLFLETNPIPVKAAVAMLGKCQETYRLPMCEMSAENREKWQAVLKQVGVI